MTYFVHKLRRAARMIMMAGLAGGLASCGGFTSVDVGGTISGLTGTGLVLANGASTVSPAPGATTFVFPDKVAIRAPYSVTITSQPSRESCAVVNGTGIAGAAPVTIVTVLCTPTTHKLGGTITGLTGQNLVLTNGSDQAKPVVNTDGTVTFTFPLPVAEGAVYGVAVLTQPDTPAQTCSVANGTAVMGATDVTNIAVTCQ